jgi:TatD DNase family protein
VTAVGETQDGAPAPAAVPAPEPLPGPVLDSHCHLDLIERPAAEVLAAAQAAGITRVVTIGTDLASSRWAARCAAEHAAAPAAAGLAEVYAAVAIHPNETTAAASSPAEREVVLAQIGELAALPRVRAIGETGLDYYRDYASPGVQRDWFRAHIAIAKRAGKALVIHDRDAHEDVLRILEDEGPPEKVIFHCFSGDAGMAKRCADAGYVMSFAGNVTFKNAQPLREAAAAAPDGLLLVETDAPFLTPVPQRGKPNSPALVAHTVRALAEIRHTPVADLCAQLTATGERMFGPW